MAANARLKGPPWIAAIAAVPLALLLVAFLRAGPATNGDPGRSAQTTAPAGDSPPGLPPRVVHAPPRSVIGAEGGPDDTAAPAQSAEDELVDPNGAEYPVDLEELRARLPDNLYWQLGEPTKDPDVLRARAEEEQRWNDLYGKVQSNTASEEEVRRYYDHRRQVSEDYVEFASVVLKEYGDRLPERDRGLYELSIKLHKARLGEIPRQVEDALARKQAHDQRREAWRQGGQ